MTPGAYVTELFTPVQLYACVSCIRGREEVASGRLRLPRRSAPTLCPRKMVASFEHQMCALRNKNTGASKMTVSTLRHSSSELMPFDGQRSQVM